METVVERPGALDVHKAQVTACVRVPADGGAREQHVAEFPTTVAGLLTLRDWLAAHAVTQVTMEATGVFWKPVVGHEALFDRVGCESPPGGPSQRAVEAGGSPIPEAQVRAGAAPTTTRRAGTARRSGLGKQGRKA